MKGAAAFSDVPIIRRTALKLPGSAGRLYNTDFAKFHHSRKSAACGSIPRNPYAFPTRVRSD